MGLATSLAALVLLVAADVWALRAVAAATEPMELSLVLAQDGLGTVEAALDRSSGALALATATLPADATALELTPAARNTLSDEFESVRTVIDDNLTASRIEAERMAEAARVFDALVPVDLDTGRPDALRAKFESLETQADEVTSELEAMLASPEGGLSIPLVQVDALRGRLAAGTLLVDQLAGELEAASVDLNEAERRLRRLIHLAAAAGLLLTAWFAAGQWALATADRPSVEV